MINLHLFDTKLSCKEKQLFRLKITNQRQDELKTKRMSIVKLLALTLLRAAFLPRIVDKKMAIYCHIVEKERGLNKRHFGNKLNYKKEKEKEAVFTSTVFV